MNETVSLSLEFVNWYVKYIYNVAAKMIVDMIKANITPVIITPVQHGKWIDYNEEYNYCCSICGNGFTDYRLSYCYDCGAKMDLED